MNRSMLSKYFLLVLPYNLNSTQSRAGVRGTPPYSFYFLHVPLNGASLLYNYIKEVSAMSDDPQRGNPLETAPIPTLLLR